MTPWHVLREVPRQRECYESTIGVVWGLYMALCYSCSSITMCGTAEPPPNHLNEHSLLEYTHHTASLPWLPGTIPGTSDKTQAGIDRDEDSIYMIVVSAWCQLWSQCSIPMSCTQNQGPDWSVSGGGTRHQETYVLGDMRWPMTASVAERI